MSLLCRPPAPCGLAAVAPTARQPAPRIAAQRADLARGSSAMQHVRRHARVCIASASKGGEGEGVGEAQPEAGASSSAGGDAAGDEPTASTSRASSSDEGVTMSDDDFKRLASAYRASKAEKAKEENLVTGVLQEIQLIEWPKPLDALLNTALVIVLVGGTSALLFGMNTLLTDLANLYYK